MNAYSTIPITSKLVAPYETMGCVEVKDERDRKETKGCPIATIERRGRESKYQA